MNKSENIDQIATALSALQGEIKDVYKDKTGHGYKYADLSTVLEIVRPLLSKHKLAVTQLCGSADEKVSVETVLMHSSGQWLSSIIEMAAEKGARRSLAQDVGNVITYARRYALAAIIGVAQTDNDAAASHAYEPQEESQFVSPQQAKYLLQLLGNDEERRIKLLDHFKLNSIEQMTPNAFSRAVDMLKVSNTKTQNITAKLNAIEAA